MRIENKKKSMAILQVANLVFSIIAIAFLIGLFNAEFVSGITPGIKANRVIVPDVRGATSVAGAGESVKTSNFLGTIAKNRFYAAFVVTAILAGVTWAITKDKEQAKAVATSVGYGYSAGETARWVLKGILKKAGVKAAGAWAGWIGLGVGLGVAAYLLWTYRQQDKEIVSFECKPWDAPVGGSDCEKCNQQGILSCSEYQCRSLGQACELINKGTDKEKCVWINRNDVKYPIVSPLNDALLEGFEYRPYNRVSPPDRGVIVWNKDSPDGCVKPFSPLSFGVSLDELAKCKVDKVRKNTFDEMQSYLGDSLSRNNHTFVIPNLLGGNAPESENLTIEGDGSHELYVRCQDANGNYNTANFVFKFCVQKGPDTTAPLIVTTNLLNNMPIAFNQSSIDLEVYVNEPADCKWSHRDQVYDKMEEQMVCSSSIFEMNAQMLYKCSTILTGLKNRIENKFYFRCKDQPLKSEGRNVNTESYEFVLIGTQPLVIDSVGPNETIKDSIDVVKVMLEARTSAGYNEGEATCYYSETGEADDYIEFFETVSYKHKQDLYLTEGSYEYFIKCIDLGGNSDMKKLNFNVETDSESPIVVRIYYEDGYLKLVTNEKADCVYDVKDCSYSFSDGISLIVLDDTEHFVGWNPKSNFYVKCQDKYGNQPMPNQCSIIARPTEFY